MWMSKAGMTTSGASVRRQSAARGLAHFKIRATPLPIAEQHDITAMCIV